MPSSIPLNSAHVVGDAGHVAAHNDLAYWVDFIAPLYGALSPSALFNANTTFANLTGLSVALAANATYKLDGFIVFDASTASDAKLQWTGPAGYSGAWASCAFGTGVSATPAVIDLTYRAITSQISLGAIGVGSKLVAPITGYVATTNAGTLQLQGAQNASDATILTFYATDSFINLSRLA